MGIPRIRNEKRNIAIRYIVVWGGSILLNTYGTYILTELSDQYFMFSKIIVSVIVAVFWNYQMQYRFVFNSKTNNNKIQIMKYRDFLQKIIYVIITPVIKGMIRIGFTPNLVTTIGFVLNIAATIMLLYAAGEMTGSTSIVGWSGAVILFAGLFDMMDGRLARIGNMSSMFGALWDSTLDRYSELFTLFGIAMYLILNSWVTGGVLTFLAMVGSVMVSYVRARAEGLGIECKVGLMQRPERVVLTSLGAILCGIFDNLWFLVVPIVIIAILANITAFWRICHCYKVLNKSEKK